MTTAGSEGSQIYLVLEAGPTSADRLATALQCVDAASVLITPQASGRLDAAEVRPLIEAAQAAGVAALVSENARLARTLRADGVHLGPSENIAADYEEARDIVGGRLIVGVHASKSRHDAMQVAEAGADYIAFGAPDFAKDRESAIARRLDLVSWWAEIFEIPCVAMDVTSPEEARELAAAGADFIGVTVPVAQSSAELRTFLEAVSEAIRQGSEARPA